MSADTRLMSMIDERTRLAGSNRMELLLFSLGGRETYGINVFKVREVCEAMPVTPAPNMKHGVEGLVSLRGTIMPVISLGKLLGMAAGAAERKLVITEFSGQVQGFLVHEVDRIVRVDWENVRAPQPMLSSVSGQLTAITELPDGKLVSILDVEQLLASVMGEPAVPRLERVDGGAGGVFFADDSALARRKIVEVLDGMGVSHQHAVNGREAWDKLQQLAAGAPAGALRKSLGLILVDAEMPEMDGYVLTRQVKSDPRFAGIPVVMHSSLSSVANRKLGQQVGVDAYVSKFHPDTLASTVRSMLAAA